MCFLGMQPFLSRSLIGMSVARVGFACGDGGTMERQHMIKLRYSLLWSPKHKWVEKWTEPGSLMTLKPDDLEAVSDSSIFKQMIVEARTQQLHEESFYT